MDSAEQAALSESDPEQQTQKSHPNVFYDARKINVYDSDGKLAEGAKHMLLRHMKRFEGLPVNVSLSSVLFSSGADFSDSDAQSAISWSSHLDPLFANNLQRDSALSWQYFGSSSGFLRRFPGTAWPPEGSRGSKEIFDFRNEDWFIQAASSPKDIIILLDSSGSMSGKQFDLAKTTAFAILDTLGDDDYVNLIAFSDNVRSVVPCFREKMVRATPDNIREFRAATNAVNCENVANFTGALETAFDLLHRYNTSGQGSQCNQAIMLITDGPSESHAELIKRYNHPHMPVRLFTYLIGKDSSSAENLNWIACSNKGYFAQIKTAEDAKKRVLEYAFVMARPMVLYQADHPVHWSPVFVGGQSSRLGKENDNIRKLVTTVSTPVFDRRNHSIRVANLLGVVGTDVPVEEIKKMIPQHKLGVNGYSFIVDNNGRILYHPDLRPIGDNSHYITMLKPKYHSIDLTEVELPEIDTSSSVNSANGNNHDRMDENSNMLQDMRHEMIQQKEGEMEITVLTHQDDMKRVALRTLRYYYGPIEGTQFSLALALPDKYGLHELVSQQEIRHSHVNVTEYFKGSNWKVHPDYVYCEYNSLKDLDKESGDSSGEAYFRDRDDTFDTPEEQVMHFLARAGRPGWKWMSVRPRSPHHSHNGVPVGHFAHQNTQTTPNQSARKAEPYFCDRTLLQSLVRDAIVTDGLDSKNTMHTTRKEDKQQGYQMFAVTTSFVATRSGLLRWTNHIAHPEDSPDLHFNELYGKAIDSTWYKRAVDQHAIEPDSFVFSVPFDSGYNSGKNSSVLVTAAHAIFIEHRGHKAPAAVVGLQFQHESLSKHFINITSACTGTGSCKKTCASDELDCYLLDNNGFVLLSERSEHTGKFFGQIDGTIMDSLVQDRIYRRVGLMDYQGICSDRDNPYSAAGLRNIPVKPMAWLLQYIFSLTTAWLTFFPTPILSWPQHAKFQNYGNPEGDFDETVYDDYEGVDYNVAPEVEEPTTPEIEKITAAPAPPRLVSTSSGPRVVPDPSHARPCDLKTDLYLLQPDRLNSSGQNNPLKGKLTNCHSSGCERPFSVQKIPHSNLILLVVDTLCPCGSKQLDIEAQEVPGGAGACGTRRQAREKLPRKRPPKCINYHPEEIEIQQCGTATTAYRVSIYSTLTASLFMWAIAMYA